MADWQDATCNFMEKCKLTVKQILFFFVFSLLVPTVVYADGLGGLSAMTALAFIYACVLAVLPTILFIIAFKLRKKKRFNSPVMLLLIFPIFLFGSFCTSYMLFPPYEWYTTLIGVIGLAFLFSVYWLYKNRVPYLNVRENT